MADGGERMELDDASVRVEFRGRQIIFRRCCVPDLKMHIQEAWWFSAKAQQLYLGGAPVDENALGGAPVDENADLTDYEQFPPPLTLTLRMDRKNTEKLLFYMEKELWKGAREGRPEPEWISAMIRRISTMIDGWRELPIHGRRGAQFDAWRELQKVGWTELEIAKWREDKYNDTILHCAVRNGHREWVRDLLARLGPDLKEKLLKAENKNGKNKNGMTPLKLSLSLSPKDFRMAQILDGGKSALDVAAQEGCAQGVKEFSKEANPLEKKRAAPVAWANGHYELCLSLVWSANAKQPGEPPGCWTKQLEYLGRGEPNLHWIVNKSENAEYIDWLLDAIPEIVLVKDKNGRTALIVAAEQGLPEYCRRILNRCASDQFRMDVLHEQDNSKKTALHAAAKVGNSEEHSEACWILHREEQKAYSTLRPASLENPSTQLPDKTLLLKMADGYTAFHIAVKEKNEVIAEKLLNIAEKENIQLLRVRTAPERGGNTACHLAAEHPKDAVLKVLIECKDRQDELWATKNNAGDTPLHLAVKRGNEKIVKLIVDASKTSWSVKDVYGSTALHYVISNKPKLLQFFVTHVGTDKLVEDEEFHEILKLKNNEGKTVYDMADMANRRDCGEQLEKWRRLG